MRSIAVIVLILGVASLALGVLFITESFSAEDEIAESIAPLALDDVDSRYDAAKAKQMEIRAAEGPAIQAGTAAPSATYNYLTIQRTSLGLTRSEIGLASYVRTSGIINIIIGAGLILAGVGLLKKSSSAV
jgi:hypothetical protein